MLPLLVAARAAPVHLFVNELLKLPVVNQVDGVQCGQQLAGGGHYSFIGDVFILTILLGEEVAVADIGLLSRQGDDRIVLSFL